MNSAHFTFNTEKAVKEFSKAQNKGISFGDSRYLSIDVQEDFFPLLVKNGVIHSAYFEGFRAHILA